MGRKRKKSTTVQKNSSVFGPIKKSTNPPVKKATHTKKRKNVPKNVPHKAASHRYKRHPAKESHHVIRNLRRHISKETRVPVTQIPFQLTLPTINAPRFRDTPWFREEILQPVDDHPSCSSRKTHDIRLPTGRCVSQASLCKLDQELLCFADYVRLSPEEHNAREYVIQQVTGIAATLFVSNSSGKKRKRGFEEKVKIQAFGSFATPQVCTFASDIDLALWGIVPVPRHTVFSSTTDDDGEGKQTSQNDKNAQLKKWKDALAELDATEREDEYTLEKELKPAAVDEQDSNATSAELAKAQTTDQAVHHQDTNESVETAKFQATDQVACVSAQSEASTKQAGDANMPENDVKPGSVDRMADANENAAPKAQLTEEEAEVDASMRQSDGAEELGGLLFVIDREGTYEFTAISEDSACVQAGEIRTETFKKAPHHESRATMSALSQPDDTTEETLSASHSQPADDANTDMNRSTQISDEVSWKGNGSAGTPLVVYDDESDHGTIDLCLDSDDDTADKLESYEMTSAIVNDDQDTAPTVRLCSTASIASTASIDQVALGEGWADEDEPEVSFVLHASKEAVATDIVGPTGENRKLVVNALKRLGNALWKSKIVHTVEVRKFARVPIITTGTHLGFEGDIALGGHNGADTSQYASSQAQRFKSFAPVVLLLKILLAQQALDKPFTGGLGSYKLYVLVAHHMEEHIALGGADRPSEVLLSFFFRFRKWCGDRRHQYHRGSAETHLSPHSMIRCDGGSAELKPVFHLEHCCKLFDQSWTRLTNKLQSDDPTVSFLGQLVKANQLRSERNIYQKKASQLSRYSQSQPRSPKKDKMTFTNYSHDFLKPTTIKDSTLPRDADDEELMAGYGMKRGPRDGLIPRNRPDAQARWSVPEVVVGRALKNRKNKKKQKRDQGLKSIALRKV